MFKASSEINREDYFYDGRLCGEMTHLLDKQECDGKLGFYSIFPINQGEEVEYHQHKGEWEVFYFLTGTGEVNDNGNIVQVAPGDVIKTPTDGWHSFKNTGENIFSFLALIIKT